MSKVDELIKKTKETAQAATATAEKKKTGSFYEDFQTRREANSTKKTFTPSSVQKRAEAAATEKKSQYTYVPASSGGNTATADKKKTGSFYEDFQTRREANSTKKTFTPSSVQKRAEVAASVGNKNTKLQDPRLTEVDFETHLNKLSQINSRLNNGFYIDFSKRRALKAIGTDYLKPDSKLKRSSYFNYNYPSDNYRDLFFTNIKDDTLRSDLLKFISSYDSNKSIQARHALWQGNSELAARYKMATGKNFDIAEIGNEYTRAQAAAEQNRRDNYFYRKLEDYYSRAENADFDTVAGKFADPTYYGTDKNHELAMRKASSVEQRIYHYLRKKEGDAAAQDFLDRLELLTNQRVMQEASEPLSELGENHKALSGVGNAVIGLGKSFAYVDNVGQALGQALSNNDTYRPYNPYTPMAAAVHFSNALKTGVTNDLTGVEKLAADLLLNVGENTVRLALGPAGLYVMGAGAAGETAVNQGVKGETNAGRAFTTGTAYGTVEIATEKLPLDNLLKILNSPPTTIKQAIVTLLKNAAVEGGEEAISNIADNIADKIINGDKSEFEQYRNALIQNGVSEDKATLTAFLKFYIQDTATDAAQGAASGVLMSGGTMAVSGGTQYFNDVTNIGQEMKNAGAAESVIDTGLKSEAQTDANKYAQKLRQRQDKGRDISDWNVGRQYLKNVKAIESEERLISALSNNVMPTETRERIFTEDGRELNGRFTGSRVEASTNADMSIPEVVKHEFSHVFKQTAPVAYQAFEDYVINAATETNAEAVGKRLAFLKSEYGYTDEVAREEIVAELTGGFNTKAATKIASGNVTLADQIASALRTAKAQIRSDFSAGRYTNSTGVQLTFEQLNNAEKLWNQALGDAAGSRGQVQTGEVRYSPIEQNSKGKYVQADRQAITSDNPDDWEGQIYNYINDQIRNGQDVVIPTDDGDNLTITEKTAWKMGYRNDVQNEDGTRRTMTDDEYKVKMNASAHIDELSEISKRGKKYVPDYKKHDFAQDGFNYRTAYFRDLDGQYYRLTISVGKNAEQNTVYNIGQIKKVPFPAFSGSKASDNVTTAKRNSYTNIIPENNGNVNTRNSVKESSEYTPNKVARRLIDEYNARGNVYVKDIQDRLKSLSEKVYDVYMTGDVEAKYPAFEAEARSIAEKIADGARVTNDTQRDEYDELRKFVKDSRVKITDELKNDIPDWNNYRKSLMGLVTFSNEGTPIDVLYKDLQERFPQYFDETEQMTQSDQLTHLADTIRGLKDSETEISDADYGTMVEDITGRIVSDAMNMANIDGKQTETQFITNLNTAVDDILNSDEKAVRENISKGKVVQVMNFTPDVILDNVRRSKNLPIIIRYDALYLATRENGAIKGHYHNIGADIVNKLPQILSNPDAIIKISDNRINLISSIRDDDGNNNLVSVELNSVKNLDNQYGAYNVIVTMFNAKDNYVKNQIGKDGVSVEYKREDLPQVNPQLYEWLSIINNSSSLNSNISNNEQNVNTSSEEVLLGSEGGEQEEIPIYTQSEYDALQEALNTERQKNWDNTFAQAEKYAEAVKQNKQDLIDERKERTDREKLLNLARAIGKMKLSPENQKKIPAILNHIDTMGINILKQGYTRDDGVRVMGEIDLKALKERYYDIKNSNPDFIPDTRVEEKISRLDRMQIGDMDIQDVRTLISTLQQVQHEIHTNNKMLQDKKNREISTVAWQSMREINRSKGVKHFRNMSVWSDQYISKHLSPTREFRKIGGYSKDGVFAGLAKDLNDGQRKAIAFQQQTYEKFHQFTSDNELMKTLMGKKAELINIGGYNKEGRGDLYITPNMRISLYLASKSYANLRHIKYGGITIPNAKLYINGKLDRAYAAGRTIRLTPTEIQEITAGMSEAERKIADIAYSFFNTDCKNAINETSLELLGYERAGVNDYFPIVTDRDFINKDFDALVYDGTLEGKGILKERTNASNPIILEDVMTVINRQAKIVGDYSGLAIPIRNFNRVYNSIGKGYGSSLKKSISEKWGSTANNYFEKLMKDLQSPVRSEHSVLDVIKGNFAQATLATNLGVTIKQAASYPTAAATLGWEPLIKGLGMKMTAEDYEIMNKYTPLWWYRSQGYSTSELGDYMNNKNENWYNKAPWLMGWIQRVDMGTTAKLWKAAEAYTEMHSPNLETGSDDYYKAVADIYNETIEDTQPNYTVMQRPDILRTDNKALSMFTMFKTQTMQNFNILADSIGEYSARAKDYKNNPTEKTKADLREARGKLGHSVSGLAVAAVVLTLMDHLGKGVKNKLLDKYKDDDGNLSLKKAFEQFSIDAINSLAGMFLGGSEAAGLVESILGIGDWYDIEAPVATVINDMATGIQSAFDTDADIRKRIKSINSIATALGTATGVPVKNIQDLFGGIANNIISVCDNTGYIQAGLFDGYKLQYLKKLIDAELNGKNASKFYSMLRGAKQHLNELTAQGVEGKKLQQAKDAYDFIYNDMLDRGVTEEKLESALKSKSTKVSEVGEFGKYIFKPNAIRNWEDIRENKDTEINRLKEWYDNISFDEESGKAYIKYGHNKYELTDEQAVQYARKTEAKITEYQSALSAGGKIEDVLGEVNMGLYADEMTQEQYDEKLAAANARIASAHKDETREKYTLQRDNFVNGETTREVIVSGNYNDLPEGVKKKVMNRAKNTAISEVKAELEKDITTNGTLVYTDPSHARDEITGGASSVVSETASDGSEEPKKVSSTRFQSTRRSSGGRRSSGSSSAKSTGGRGGKYVSVAAASTGNDGGLIRQALGRYTGKSSLPSSYKPEIVQALDLIKARPARTVKNPLFT